MNGLLLFYRTVSLLTAVLPRRVAYAAAKAASAGAYRNRHVIRRAVAANLRIVFEARGLAMSDSELAQMARSTFDNFGKYVVDFFQLGRLSPAALDQLVKVEHIEYLEQCRSMERGIIGLSAHLGSWELGANVLERYGCRINAVVRPQPSARLDALFESRRANRGISVLPMGGGASFMSACLKRGELVVLLGDLDFSAKQRRTSFFGKPARLPRGPAVLAARTGAPILPAFILREPDETFRFCLYPPIIPDQFRSIDDIQGRIRSVLEEVIGNHPDQWFAFNPVW
ncbi:lysophospholipid acyltransferase family protein [Pontiella sulfatireligans]|uniref:Phosphatidylinositol mannoside acyltransferase n=1 Tax=Pontiella sulfatireligans TaxID=2750658 RepID=A0A6C2UFE1_9BACT|nr:lysophospholipid acyltransferase family protein [Pontiella sulfatireligans]VGO18141.1 Phosphatidylinositol mannoside acyltransferase [Pontiella sulfatireligans]